LLFVVIVLSTRDGGHLAFRISPPSLDHPTSIFDNNLNSFLLKFFGVSLEIMTDPPPSSLYRMQYEEAVRLFDNDKMEECIAAAKCNLT
jgi:hypothetical protein